MIALLVRIGWYLTHLLRQGNNPNSQAPTCFTNDIVFIAILIALVDEMYQFVYLQYTPLRRTLVMSDVPQPLLDLLRVQLHRLPDLIAFVASWPLRRGITLHNARPIIEITIHL